MSLRWFAPSLLCCIAACGSPAPVGPAAPERSPEAGAAPGSGRGPVSGAGGPLVFRFVDHAAEAEVSGDLGAGWASITDHPQRSLLPWGLPGAPGGRIPADLAFRAVQVAFADSDVEDYARPGEAGRAVRPVRALDPVWNRTRAVYLSRQALYVPAGARQAYRVRLPTAARLELGLGLLAPPGGRGTLQVTVDGAPVLEETLAAPGTWRRAAVDLGRFAGREVTVAFTVEGPARTHGFFANPLLWGAAPSARPNLLVIFIDTLRADALAVMPRLSAWAEKGARFDQAITAATWTRPSLLALYGGDLPAAVGQSAENMIPEDIDRRRFYRLAPPLLPRLLSARGYRASAIGNNFFLLAYPAIGLDMGFEEVDDIRHPVLDTPAITRAALRYLEENRDHPFFLDLHYDAPHWPYTPPEGWLEKVAPRLPAWPGDPALLRDPQLRRYLAEAAWADEHVGQVLDALERLGLSSRTLVVIAGDHGEVFDPAHDQQVAALALPTRYHHGWSAWDEVLRVPLLLGLPGTIPAVRVGDQVRLFDVASTVADYLGLEAAGLPARGRSLRPLVEGRERGERVAFVEGQNVRALRAEGLLYLRRDDGRLVVGNRKLTIDEELYDLVADPAQHQDLAARDPVRLARMRALFRREAPVPPEPPGVTYHLRVADDDRPHLVEGTVSVGAAPPAAPRRPGAPPAAAPPGARVAVREVRGGEVAPGDARTIRFHLRAPASLDFVVEPPDAPLQLDLRVDGVPVEPGTLLAGEFAIPVVDGPLAGERLRRLDARRPPQPGHHGELLLYRDPGSRLEAAAPLAEAKGQDEVTGMMQRWGYAQPGAKAAPK